ncbi:MAG: hypothetical protein NXH78_04955 [Hyphomonadaceae bacterium]|nr:hypothetical protein [Hyphomonadaceae bacterium]
MFKRPHLRAAKRLVNAPFTLSLLFLAAACNPGGEPVASDVADSPVDSVESAQPEGLELPAVWQTKDLESPIASVALAGAIGSTVAVTFEDGGLQFLDFEGERVTDKADMAVSQVADGRYMLLQGTPVTIFPGITSSGDLSLYIHGGELDAPLPLPLDAGVDGLIEGLCSAGPVVDSDGVMRIGFWTQEERRQLHTGRIVEAGADLILLLNEPIAAARDISACLLSEGDAVVFTEPVLAAAEIKHRNNTYRFLLDDLGGYSLSTEAGDVETFTVHDGISVRPPTRPVDMAATGDARGGGYPGGVMVIGGEDIRGAHTVTFVDPSKVTAEPFGYSPSE